MAAYLYFREGWPPLYACLNDMPVEDHLVFQYMLRTEKAHKESGAALNAVRAAEALSMERVLKQSGFS